MPMLSLCNVGRTESSNAMVGKTQGRNRKRWPESTEPKPSEWFWNSTGCWLLRWSTPMCPAGRPEQRHDVYLRVCGRPYELSCLAKKKMLGS